ncbi:MAG: UbiA family prenyltransferase [Actinomycetota bacterium]
MLRYRAALMIWLFMLLGAARHGGLGDLGAAHAAALLALAASYVAATSINDVADVGLDRINHPGDPARPLVTGQADEHDLRVIYAGAVAAALAAGAAVGAAGLALVAVGLILGYVYSAPPFAVSYRTYLSPLLLATAYVVIPYSLGVAASNAVPDGSDVLPLGAFVVLFLARIVLKDFRDREGDAAYGRRTLLQRFGRRAVCRTSLGALLTADALLVAVLLPSLALILVIQGFFGAIVWMLWNLEAASDPQREQVAIGIGARLGNGLLLTVLGSLVLEARDAPAGEVLLYAWSLAAIYAINFAALMAHPDEVLIGYKG